MKRCKALLIFYFCSPKNYKENLLFFMSANIKVKRGVDIKLKGVANKAFGSTSVSETFVVKPTDFHGLTPKLVVKVGQEVKAGSVLFYDKYNDRVKFTSPVSGEVAEIVRGAKRKVLEVRILADKEIKFESFEVADPATLSRDAIVEAMLNSGLWPFLRQRPYSIVANPAVEPKAIHVTGFDSAPLSPDYAFLLEGEDAALAAGMAALTKLTSGKVHLNAKAGTSVKAFLAVNGAQKNQIEGPHPAGLAGVQIHHIDPINKGDYVWHLTALDVVAIGKFFKTGQVDMSRAIAVTGSEVAKPQYYKTRMGTSLKQILADAGAAEGARVISGNPLTGTTVGADGYLGFFDYQVSVLPEGDEPEFFGWAIPNTKKFSLSRTFLSWMAPGKEYSLNTSLNGEERAFVMSGEYDQVFPFDIYPVQLVKALMANDIELAEQLGVYEVAPEDFALCEFACTSKIELQSVVREGLDLIQKECG